MPQLLPLAAGAIARVVGTRVAAGAATRAAAGGASNAGRQAAAGRAMNFGGRAVQQGAMQRQQQHQQPAPRQPGAVARTTDWARHNPVEAAIALRTVAGGNSLAQQANADFDSVVQPRQFSG